MPPEINQGELAEIGLPLLVTFGFLCVASFITIGYAMKLALKASGAGSFGFWQSLGYTILASIIGSIVSTIVVVSMGGNAMAGLLGMVGSIGGFAVTIGILSGCGWLRGLLVYFYNGVFSFIGFLFVFGACLVALSATGSMSKLASFADKIQQHQAIGDRTGLAAFSELSEVDPNESIVPVKFSNEWETHDFRDQFFQSEREDQASRSAETDSPAVPNPVRSNPFAQ